MGSCCSWRCSCDARCGEGHNGYRARDHRSGRRGVSAALICRVRVDDGAGECGHSVWSTGAGTGSPAHESVGDIRDVAMCCDSLAEISTRRDGAGVVDARCDVVLGNVGRAGVGEAVYETPAAGRS